VALACLLVFGLVSCARAAGPETPAALKYADDGTEWCTSVASHPDLAVGIAVDPTGDESIVIKSVKPVDESGMKIAGTWVVPIDPDNRIGAVRWPVSGDRAGWSKRRQAVDATLKPGEHHDLVLHVQYTGPQNGSVRDVKVTYEQDGKTRTADTHVAIRMAQGEC
jgi:hypothetical protein